ncbi:MAG: sulfatase, partial [Gemmatimonadota bacterium]
RALRARTITAAPRRRMGPRVQRDRQAYEAAVAALDHEVGRLLEELERRGRLRNTVVVVTSDHGEQFGEHGLTRHDNSLYMPLLHVPLILVFPPRVPGGLRVAEAVSLRDLPATLLELLGVRDDPLPGSSLAPLWGRSPAQAAVQLSPLLSTVRRGINRPAWEPVSRGDMYSIIDEHLHFIRNGDGQEELYDLEGDPEELHDLAQLPAVAADLARLRANMHSVVAGPRADSTAQAARPRP